MNTTECIETDVLCIGGGIAGLMAAIRAGESGVRVVVAEKGNTLTSGAGGIGNDHFVCWIPEVHGNDVMALINELRRGQLKARLKDLEKARRWIENSFEIVKLWDKWGIPMKYDGKWEFAGHAFPGEEFPCHLKYAGRKQKTVLTREARKRGVTIINRIMMFELIQDEGLYHAIGWHTQEGRLLQFRAKTVVLGTGIVTRLFQGLTPGWMWNATRPGTLTGDGRMMAYKAGAELFNMETLEHHAGPKYFSRSGQATWVGVVRDPFDRPLGPYLQKPDKRYSDMIVEVDKGLFSDYAAAGKGPVYMDCRGISEEDYAYMTHWMKHEGFSAFTDYLHDKGIDLRKNPIEWATYGMRGSCGSIWQDNNGQTSMPGLYVAGDETTRSISPAANFGWIAGEHAANFSRNVTGQESKKAQVLLEQKDLFLKAIQERHNGPDWKEVNIALTQIMSDYVGALRSEKMLEAGLFHLDRLQKEALETVMAHNPHEIMRTLEVLNLIELGRLVCIVARERKESRGLHRRSDYTYADPMLDKYLILKNVDGQPVTFWR